MHSCVEGGIVLTNRSGVLVEDNSDRHGDWLGWFHCLFALFFLLRLDIRIWVGEVVIEAI